MAKYKDLKLINEEEGVKYNILGEDGETLYEGVTLEIADCEWLGDEVGAREFNALFEKGDTIDEPPTLKVATKQELAVVDNKAVTADGKAVKAQNTADKAQGVANTAVSNAATAQSTANSALTKANAALPKAGGTISGNLKVDGSTTSEGSVRTESNMYVTRNIYFGSYNSNMCYIRMGASTDAYTNILGHKADEDSTYVYGMNNKYGVTISGTRRLRCTHADGFYLSHNLGIRVTQQTTNTLTPVVASAFNTSSSITEKENVERIDNKKILPKLMKTHFYEYDRKVNGQHQMGVIIEDETTPEEILINDVAPKDTAVETGKLVDMYSYTTMVAKSIVELKEEMDRELRKERKRYSKLLALLKEKGLLDDKELNALF